MKKYVFESMLSIDSTLAVKTKLCASFTTCVKHSQNLLATGNHDINQWQTVHHQEWLLFRFI